MHPWHNNQKYLYVWQEKSPLSHPTNHYIPHSPIGISDNEAVFFGQEKARMLFDVEVLPT